MTASQNLADLGIELPTVATPLGSYLPALRDGQHVLSCRLMLWATWSPVG